MSLTPGAHCGAYQIAGLLGTGGMVRAQHLLVVEGLNVNHLRLVMGTSMGGMRRSMTLTPNRHLIS